MMAAEKALIQYCESTLRASEETLWESMTNELDGTSKDWVRYRYTLPVGFDIDVGRATLELEKRNWSCTEEDGALVFRHEAFVPAAGLLADPAYLDVLSLEDASRSTGASTPP